MPAINFKDPSRALAWLDTALEKEKEKYKKCPVQPDMMPGHEAAQGWGYVIVGYFLVEEAFKAILHFRGREVPQKHVLVELFGCLDEKDKTVLRGFYDDYKASAEPYLTGFPFQSIDDFLLNLDGDKGKGSFEWRYFPIEIESDQMPLVSVDYLHEVAYGSTIVLEYLVHGKCKPLENTRSYRLWWARKRKYIEDLDIQVASPDWDETKKKNRVEKLWGPDGSPPPWPGVPLFLHKIEPSLAKKGESRETSDRSNHRGAGRLLVRPSRLRPGLGDHGG